MPDLALSHHIPITVELPSLSTLDGANVPIRVARTKVTCDHQKGGPVLAEVQGFLMSGVPTEKRLGVASVVLIDPRSGKRYRLVPEGESDEASV